MTHVLLAVSCLLRRADGVDVIGAALRMKAVGVGHRPIAARLARPVSTVRGWLRAFARNAETVRSVFTALLVQLDPLTAPLPGHPGVFADAVEVVGACAAAARRRLGAIGAVSPWQLASTVTGGRLLAPRLSAVLINTSRPLGTAFDQRPSRLVCSFHEERRRSVVAFSHDEERVRAERARAIGLFRYSLIRVMPSSYLA